MGSLMGKLIFALLLAAVSSLHANEDCIDCPSTLSGLANEQPTFTELEQIQESTCPVEKTDHVIIGDSQNGATWSTSYFGNFFQKCLAEQSESFVSYARGGSTPAHWVSHAGNDRIATLMRNNSTSGKQLVTSELPLCQKRLKEMIAGHQATKVTIFLGGNLTGSSEATVKSQFNSLLQQVAVNNIAPENCTLITPTYEMAVATHRAVANRTLENTKKIINGIKSAAQGKCKVIDGLEVMKNSSLFDASKNTLKRIGVEGTAGCLGANRNDNIHLCGEAAKEYANKVCQLLR